MILSFIIGLLLFYVIIKQMYHPHIEITKEWMYVGDTYAEYYCLVVFYDGYPKTNNIIANRNVLKIRLFKTI